MINGIKIDDLIRLPLDFKDYFVWRCEDIPRLALDREVHKLEMIIEAIPIKQAPRRKRLHVEQKVIFEV